MVSGREQLRSCMFARLVVKILNRRMGTVKTTLLRLAKGVYAVHRLYMCTALLRLLGWRGAVRGVAACAAGVATCAAGVTRVV